MSVLPSEEKHLLAFVVDKKTDGLMSIHFDLAGIDYFIRELSTIRKHLLENQIEHFHMFSAEWGDGALSISTNGESMDDGIPIHQINGYGWTDELVEKQGFNRS